MNTPDFKKLLKNYKNGNCTPEEKILIENWYLHEAKKQYFPIEEIDFNNAKSDIWNSIQNNIKSKTIINHPKATINWINIAAAIAIVVGIAFTFNTILQFSNKPTFVVLTKKSTGKTSKIILSDGSIIWLKGKSSITYPSKFTEKQRKITLQGEAFFEVAKDPSHPFIITCGNITAKVLGTSFNLKEQSKNVEVALFTGKVSLTEQGKPEVIIKPLEKATYNAINKNIVIQKSSTDEQKSYTADTEYENRFDDTPIHEVMKHIGAKFNLQVTILDNQINNMVITADFTDLSLDKTLALISQSLQLKCELTGNKIALSIEK